MRSLPPLVSLQTFEAAARLLSFKDAAAELGVTPTAVSHQIKLLETHCGQALFRRQPRPIALTRAGERLLPYVRAGFESFAAAMVTVRRHSLSRGLRVTATNAFAARWLMPRLPLWRAAYPKLKLEIAGTDAVLSVAQDETDIAVRYARHAPTEAPAIELVRDRFFVVASPKLIGRARRPMTPSQLARFPLIEAGWPESDADAPTWRRWTHELRRLQRRVPELADRVSLDFREELHAIEAAITGQGIAICSDVLVAPELASGALVKVATTSLPGYGFYLMHRASHPRLGSIKSFVTWARSVG